MSRLLAALLLSTLPAVAADKTAEELAEQVKPSLCAITTRGRDATERGLGTGFVISADGLIATAAHVVGEGRPIAVEFPDGKKYPATTVHAHDHKLDLAVVKIDAKGLKPLPLGDSAALKDGHPVVAFGNPKGLRFSVVSGVVSATR
jgi:serine protease Do